jgi:hypothetical protein
MTEAICLDNSGCIVRVRQEEDRKSIDVLFNEHRAIVGKVQAVEVSLAEIAGTGKFIRWALPIAVTSTGVICTILTFILGQVLK